MTLWPPSFNKWRRRDKRVVPSGTLIGILVAVAVLNFLFANGFSSSVWLWAGVTLVLLAISLYDLASLRGLRIAARRDLTLRPQLHIPFEVAATVRVTPSALRLLDVDLGLVYPLVPAGPLVRHDSSTVVVEQKTMPLRRGLQTVAPLDCRVQSRWGLWHCLVRSTQATEVLVVPDLTTWRREAAVLSQTLQNEGWHVKRGQLGDSEFSHVADYVPDDDPRRINWAATARRGRLMKNVYQPERGQQLIIAVDASRYMQVELSDGKTRLDYALESAAALAYAAMAAGDKVGVVAFTHRLLFSLPPRRDAVHWRRIVLQLAALEAESVQGDYENLLRNLQGSFHRRSLLVLISELEGVVSDKGFFAVLSRTQRQHPTVFVTLEQTSVLQTLQSVPQRTGDIARLTAARMVLEERMEVRRQLRQSGVTIIESRPGDVAVAAVAAYLRRRQQVGH